MIRKRLALLVEWSCVPELPGEVSGSWGLWLDLWSTALRHPEVREARVENIFRYAHAFPRCVNMIASGAIDVKPLITRTFDFKDSVRAFEIAASAPPGDVKMQIELPQ